MTVRCKSSKVQHYINRANGFVTSLLSRPLATSIALEFLKYWKLLAMSIFIFPFAIDETYLFAAASSVCRLQSAVACAASRAGTMSNCRTILALLQLTFEIQKKYTTLALNIYNLEKAHFSGCKTARLIDEYINMI
jgi:hypothetical protein